MMKKILIVGAGFSGVFIAKNLFKLLKKSGQKNIQIELINAHNYFIFQPLLPEVSSGIINPHDAVSPLRMLLPKIKHRLAVVKQIDKKNHQIQVLQGRHKKLISIDYDELIIACGQTNNLNLTGFAEHTFTMKTLNDAFLLRNHILQCLELADVTLDEAVKKSALTFVVVGAGFSGVETIGELQDMVHRALKYYPNITPAQVQFILLQGGRRILQQLPESLANYAQRKLQKRGVEIRLNISVSSASTEYVALNNGEKIPALTIVTTIGSGAFDFITNNFDLKHEKIQVNEYMQVLKTKNIWALGDAALIPMGNGQYAPSTAQFAVREAKVLAHNLLQHLFQQPKKPFQFKPIGIMASIGAYQGVAQISKLRLSGVLAWAIWRGVYITKIPGNMAKIRISLNWMMDYFFPRTLVQIVACEKKPIKYLYFNKNDVVCDSGEIIKNLYLIISGSVICKTQEEDKILTEQHYFPDTTSADNTHQGQVYALEKTKILSISQDVFLSLRQDFRQFDKIFTK